MSTVAEEIYQDFMTKAFDAFKFDCEEVKRLLKKHGYGSFRTGMIDTYMAVLRAEWNELDEQKIQREQEKAETPNPFPVFEAIPCPVCGAPTVGDLRWRGKVTHKPGWRCTKGGIAHFLWAKANECRCAQGLEPLPWEIFIAEHSRPDFSVPITENA